jgi:hypothetical protein
VSEHSSDSETSNAYLSDILDVIREIRDSLAERVFEMKKLPVEGTVQAPPLAGYGSFCPICGGESVSRCRCNRADSVCANGHGWHLCEVHKALVVGTSDHGQRGCTCRTAKPAAT